MCGKTLAAVAALTCGGHALLSAQASACHPAASALFTPARDLPADSIHYPGTYWKEGALVLGIPFALIAGDFAYQMCKDPDSGTRPRHCVANGLGGAAVGFVIGAVPGALIGGLIRKHE